MTRLLRLLLIGAQVFALVAAVARILRSVRAEFGATIAAVRLLRAAWYVRNCLGK